MKFTPSTRGTLPTLSFGDLGCGAGRTASMEAPLGVGGRIAALEEPEWSGGDVRWELVERVRGELEDGLYATDEKLNLAIDRLLQDL